MPCARPPDGRAAAPADRGSSRFIATESVNGVPGKKVPGKFTIPAPAGPEGTVGSDGGAGHEHEGS